MTTDATPTCARNGCERFAELYPVLLAYAPGCAIPAQLVLRLPVCAEHAIQDPDEYVTDLSWQQIVTQFKRMGKAVPDRTLTQITFVTVAEGEEVMAKARRQTP